MLVGIVHSSVRSEEGRQQVRADVEQGSKDKETGRAQNERKLSMHRGGWHPWLDRISPDGVELPVIH